ncbi:MAG: D-cysteine desulfhydrase family protein [Firmicutes bacterium]|nr:D-cysteine desulfhydrase family protein [Bacillota bacterium]
MKHFEKESLGLFPTPMHRLPNISRELGTNVWIKRDDLCGVALGGNKVRKLEYLLHDAKQQGYDLIMTTGQAQSNHAMLTAACARRLGLDCILLLKDRGITARKGNQILNHLLGVEVRYMDTDSYDEIYREMDRIGAELGRKVYKIPCGGSNALGTLGYIDCMREIAASGQHFDHLVCACGSGGTAAGCVLGATLHLPHTQVMCSMVDNEPFEQIVTELMQQAAELLEIPVDIPVPQLLDMCGPGYSIPSAEGNAAIGMMMQLEGIVLDTCYTGKAFAGLVRRAKEGYYKADDNVLFIHTGGAGGLFAQDWDAE